MDAIHLRGPSPLRPLPQQNGTVRSGRRQEHPFTLHRIQVEHQPGRQRVDERPRRQGGLNGSGDRDRQPRRAIDYLLPGTFAAQGQYPLTQQRGGIVRGGNHPSHAFISGDGGQGNAMPVGPGDGNQIRGVDRRQQHLHPEHSRLQRCFSRSLLLQYRFRLTKLAVA